MTPVTPARPAGITVSPTEARRKVVRLPERLPRSQRCKVDKGGGGRASLQIPGRGALASEVRWRLRPEWGRQGYGRAVLFVCWCLLPQGPGPPPPPAPEGSGTAKPESVCAWWKEGPQGVRPLCPAPPRAPGGTQWQEKVVFRGTPPPSPRSPQPAWPGALPTLQPRSVPRV